MYADLYAAIVTVLSKWPIPVQETVSTKQRFNCSTCACIGDVLKRVLKHLLPPPPLYTPSQTEIHVAKT